MKGLETKVIFGLIILVAVIVLIAIVVFQPSLAFGKSTQSRTKFEEFCVFWSLDNYAEDWSVELKSHPNTLEWMVNNKPVDYCPTVGISAAQDIDKCRSCCKKEVVC